MLVMLSLLYSLSHYTQLLMLSQPQGRTSALLHFQPLTDIQRYSPRCNTPCWRIAWPIPWFQTAGQGPQETHAVSMEYGVSNTSCSHKTWPSQVFMVKMSISVGDSGKHGPLGDPSPCIRYWGTICLHWRSKHKTITRHDCFLNTAQYPTLFFCFSLKNKTAL